MTRPRIMIVEDEVLTSLALRNDLRDLGYSVCSLLTSGEKAIEAAEMEKPDAVLMDIKLNGELDGYSAAKEISSRLDIPIIFMSGYPLYMIEKEAEMSESYGYISKPIEISDVKRAIESVLQKKMIPNQDRHT